MAETVGINVVFTDLVGSTEMSNRLGPEATEALRVVHFGLLRAAIDTHGGTEVKNLGDGLMIVFPSLGATLDGSVAIQQAIERHNAVGKEPLGVRVGIATGDATEEDDDYFGEPVVEAARLCAKCEPGQIIVSQLTSMIARSSGHSFTSIGDLELRGMPEPVASMTVDWEPVAVQGAAPIPERLIRDMDLRIAGRKDHLDALCQALKDAESGTQRATFLAGEPGIGKTRLSCELAEIALGRGALALYGRCDEELSLPYQPWVEAIGYFLEHGPSDLVQEVVRLHGPELSLLIPQIRRRYSEIEAPAASDAETERYQLLQAVTSVVALICRDNPVLLVLDDLHWADKPTLTMLRHVFTNGSARSLMVVGTYRDSDLETGHPLIDTVAALRRENGVEQLSVRGLDGPEIIELVEISAEHDLDEAMVSLALTLRQETAGNPFFAHEILRNLVEVGEVTLGDDGRWIVQKTYEEMTLPQSVRDVVGQRIARMGDASLNALRAAAVVGKEFDLALVAEVTDTDEDDLLDMFEAAIAAGILAEVPDRDERFRFLHTVTRNTLQAELSDGRRRRTHRKIAEALERAYGEDPGDRIGELATHWLAASVSIDSVKATEYAQLAGRRAQVSLAPDEAIRWFVTALEAMEEMGEPDEQLRAQILVDLGTAQRDGGDPTYRQTLLSAGAKARQLGAADLTVAAALANNRGMYSKLGERDHERVEALQQALDAVGVERTASRALLLATLFTELEYSGEYDERSAMIGEAEDIARELDDDTVLCAVLNRLCVSMAAPHTLSKRLAASDESLAIAQALGDITLEFWARCGVFQATLGSSDLAKAELVQASLAQLAEASARPTLTWIAGNLRGTLLAAFGLHEQMELVITANFELGSEIGEPDAFDYYLVGILTVRWIQGRHDEIIDQLLDAASRMVEIPAYHATATMFLAEIGEYERARESLGQEAANGFEFRINNSWSGALTPCGVVADLLDDVDAARPVYEALVPFRGQMACNQAYTMRGIDGVLGGLASVLGRVDEAEVHFAEAEVSARSNGSQWTLANDALGQANHYRRIGRIDDAQDRASRCLVTSRDRGFANLEKRARELLGVLTAT